MKFGIMLAFLLVKMLCLPSNFSNEEDKFSGIWSGKLEVSGMQLRIVIKIDYSDNKYSARFDSPDQGVKDIKFTTTRIQNDSLELIFAPANAVYKGLVKDKIIEGKWIQNNQEFVLLLDKTDKVPEIKRPQTPQEPYSYKTEEVSFLNTEDNVTLGGTLTTPANGSDFRAVVLVSGSGPQDRDETLFMHKPFAVIADYLTKKGIAVLRYDDRGIGKSTGDFSSATTINFAKDAEAAVDFLRTRKEINKNSIGIIGHSEGGLIAPMVAAGNPDVAFIVLLAGPGEKGRKILEDQTRLILQSQNIDPELIKTNLQLSASLYDEIEKTSDNIVRKENLKSILKKFISDLGPEKSLQLGIAEKNIEPQVNQLASEWFRFFLTYDPAVSLKEVDCPVLALNGDKDLQVPSKTNLEAIRNISTKSGNRRVKTLEFKNLNHLFQNCTTGSVAEYSQIEETISPEVLSTIEEWIRDLKGK